MLVRELLNEEQLDEASLKQMIAGAALALGLGISGSASADQLFVYLSPETGKLRAVTDMSRVPANATMSFKVDTDAKTVSMIKGANAPVSPEVAKSAVQSAPKSNPTPVKVAEPENKPDNTKSATSADKSPDELDQVKKNAGVTSKDLSQFSIKGIRFGMSFNDILKVTNATRDDFSKSPDKDYKWPQKSVDDWMEIFKNFSIAGETGWNALTIDGESFGNKGELGAIYTKIDPDDFQKVLQRFSQQYGKPEITNTSVRNKMNFSGTNVKAYWKVKDVNIIIEKYAGKFTEGSIQIVSDKYHSKQMVKDKETSNKASKDF
jgi:hypothetical protein